MSDQSAPKGISDEERATNKVMYVGKRLYSLFVEVASVLHEAQKQGVTELGIFGELDATGYVEAARELGQVPNWSEAPVTRKLVYDVKQQHTPIAN